MWTNAAGSVPVPADRSSGAEHALKAIDKSKCRGKEQMIENEVSILRRVRHPNIIQLVEEFDFPSELYLVMELVKVTSATADCSPTHSACSMLVYQLHSE